MQVRSRKLNVFRNRVLLSSLLLLTFVYNYATFNRSVKLDKVTSVTNTANTSYRDSLGYKALLKAYKKEGRTGCILPRLEPTRMSPDVTPLLVRTEPLDCGEMDWVECTLSTCRVKMTVLSAYETVKCVYTPVAYGTDGHKMTGPPTTCVGPRTFQLVYTDHAAVACTGRKQGDWFARAKWSSLVTGIRLIDRDFPTLSPYDILVVGLQSASRVDFMGTMRDTYWVLTEELGAVVMEGYHVLGDSVSSSLMPVLSGRLEQEARQPRMRGHSLPPIFIWDYLGDIGFESAVFEDNVHVERLMQRMSRTQPTLVDHLATQVFVEAAQLRGKPHCLGGRPAYEVMLRNSYQLLTKDNYKNRKFVFNHITDVKKDGANYLSVPDDYLSQWLLDVKRSGILNNTLLILMGDQGSKYDLVSGALEDRKQERLPLLAVVLPKMLVQRDPGALANLKHNSKQLTVPFDVFATLLDVAALYDLTPPALATRAIPTVDIPRAMSLLTRIPESRACPEAGIEPRWCSCRPRHPRKNKNKAIKRKKTSAEYEH